MELDLHLPLGSQEETPAFQHSAHLIGSAVIFAAETITYRAISVLSLYFLNIMVFTLCTCLRTRGHCLNMNKHIMHTHQ